MAKNKPDYIGKFAIIKDEVELKWYDSLTHVHNHPYKIINQNKKRSFICLETNVFSCLISNFGVKHETIDRSFWMNVEDCNIIDK